MSLTKQRADIVTIFALIWHLHKTCCYLSIRWIKRSNSLTQVIFVLSGFECETAEQLTMRASLTDEMLNFIESKICMSSCSCFLKPKTLHRFLRDVEEIFLSFLLWTGLLVVSNWSSASCNICENESVWNSTKCRLIFISISRLERRTLFRSLKGRPNSNKNTFFEQ